MSVLYVVIWLCWQRFKTQSHKQRYVSALEKYKEDRGSFGDSWGNVSLTANSDRMSALKALLNKEFVIYPDLGNVQKCVPT
jgi:hypothetical protein